MGKNKSENESKKKKVHFCMGNKRNRILTTYMTSKLIYLLQNLTRYFSEFK